MLKVEGLQRRIGDFALEADFAIADGERAALFARSGSGKTTLLRILAGLEGLDTGRIDLNGREITRLPVEKRDIGYVFQAPSLFPALSTLENAVFGLKLRGVARARELGLEWLERVGLAGRAEAPVRQLSGGEAQRVAFVRALIWKPRLILLDEPFSALDPALRAQLRETLLQLHALAPAPLLIVSHDEGDVSSLATCRLGITENAGRRRISRL